MTEENTTIPVNTDTAPSTSSNDIDDEISRNIKDKNAKGIKEQEDLDTKREESRRWHNYDVLKKILIEYNPEYQEGFEKQEAKESYHYKLEPQTIWNYCKAFYDGECDIAKYFPNASKKKIFEEIIDTDTYSSVKHHYSDLQAFQEHVESIVKFKKDQDIELQRQSLSFLGAGGYKPHSKTSPKDTYNAWRRGEISTEEFSSGIDKFYKNRHGSNYIGSARKIV